MFRDWEGGIYHHCQEIQVPIGSRLAWTGLQSYIVDLKYVTDESWFTSKMQTTFEVGAIFQDLYGETGWLGIKGLILEQGLLESTMQTFEASRALWLLQLWSSPGKRPAWDPAHWCQEAGQASQTSSQGKALGLITLLPSLLPQLCVALSNENHALLPEI